MIYDTLKILSTGIITSIITILITNKVQRSSLKKEAKREFVRKVYGYRYQLGNGRKEQTTEWELSYLLGQVPIMFGDNKEVLKVYKKIIYERSDENLFLLLLEMCKDSDVGIKTTEWDRDMVTRWIKVD